MPKSKKRILLTPAERRAIELGWENPVVWSHFFLDGFEPTEKQLTFLMVALHGFQNPDTNERYQPKELNWSAAARAGKSLGIAFSHTFTAFYFPEKKVANGSITADQATVVFREAEKLCNKPRMEKFILDIVRHPFPTIYFQNGAEMWFRSLVNAAEFWYGWGQFVWINVDEAALVRDPVTFDVLRTRLMDENGVLSLTGTPKGRGVYSYRHYLMGCPPSATHFSMHSTTWDNPHISKAAIERVAASLSTRMREQEIEGAFLDYGGSVFPEADVDGCRADDLQQILNDYIFARFADDREYDMLIHGFEFEPEAGRRYAQGWDLARGRKADEKTRKVTGELTVEDVDWAVGIVADVTEIPFQIVAWKRITGRSWGIIYNEMRRWAEKYRAFTAFDATGMGDPAEDALADVKKKYGLMPVKFTGPVKDGLITLGQQILAQRAIVYPYIKPLDDELKLYSWDDKDIPTDNVFALLILLWAAREKKLLPHGAYKTLVALKKPTRKTPQPPWVRRELQRIQAESTKWIEQADEKERQRKGKHKPFAVVRHNPWRRG